MKLEPPSSEQAVAWTGFRVDEPGGSSVGRVGGVFRDSATGEPAWLIAKLGRFGKTIAIPFRDCAAGIGHVWVPYERSLLRAAPGVDPEKPLTREQELAICSHYGISERVGRGLEVAERPEGSVSAQAAGADAG